jgi:hypothetical protein
MWAEGRQVNWIADHAALLLVLPGIPFTLGLLPTIWTQHKEKASTVTLPTSLTNVIGLLAVSVVFVALGYWPTFAMDLVNTVFWLAIVYQRIQYGHRTEVANNVARILIDSLDDVNRFRDLPRGTDGEILKRDPVRWEPPDEALRFTTEESDADR